MPDPILHSHGLEPFLSSISSATDCAEQPGIRIGIEPGLCHINLRGDPGSVEFIDAVNSVLQQDLPLAANTMTTGNNRIYWLGPNEWLIISSLEKDKDRVTNLRESVRGQHACVTDLSGGQLALRINGPHARDVLAKGCTLDFHPSVFHSGHCAQSGLAKTGVLIGLLDDGSEFEIVVRRSFVDYLAHWLQHAAEEFGVEFSVI